jgi:hypothetical protein
MTRASHVDDPFGFFITILVMAVAEVSAAHQNAVGPHLEGLENKVRGDPARTHDPDHPNVRRVLQSTDPGQVSPGIGAPVAAKSDDFWFEFSSHEHIPLLF